MNKWRCLICDYIYDENKGLPETGMLPGTLFQDIPDDWICPDCEASKSDFELVQEDENKIIITSNRL